MAQYSTTANYGWRVPDPDDKVNTFNNWGVDLNLTLNAIDSETNLNATNISNLSTAVSDLEGIQEIVLAQASSGLNLTIPASTWTVITYNSETVDDGGQFSPTTGIFTSNKTQTVQVIACCFFAMNAGNNRRQVAFYKDGASTNWRDSAYWPSTSNHYINASAVLQCVTNTTISFRMWSNVAGSVSISEIAFSRIK